MKNANRKHRIFMIGYSTDKGGVESYIHNVCELLKIDFDILLHWPKMSIDGKEWITPRNRHNFLKYRAFWKNFFEENHFDVIYFNTCDIISIDLLKFAKAANIPIRILHSHSTAIQAPQKGIVGLLHKYQEKSSRRNLSKYATHLLACSKTAGDWMFDGRDYQIIKNGISIPNYQFSIDKGNNASSILKYSSHPAIACIGRLDSPKNPFFSLDIFREICKINKNAQCLFIGNGKYRAALEEMVRHESLEHRIIFTGGVDNVNEWLSFVDCIVMPSLFEGLPFVLVEAQAAGLHCLVSDTVSEEANITGLIKYKSLNHSPAEWAKCALKCADLPRQDVSKLLVEAGFSIEHTANTIKNLIFQSLQG